MNLPYIFKPLYEYDFVRLCKDKDNEGGYLIGLNTIKKTIKSILNQKNNPLKGEEKLNFI
tara:strand:+ start:260 stop:439 length:180 start_codon:yes stop_codon:yes gene_type:complete